MQLESDEKRLRLSLRYREATDAHSGAFREAYKTEAWDPQQTALLICDMWDRHWCASATRRVEELAPAVDRTVREARRQGIFILHAPSATMPFYEGTPQRRRAQMAPAHPSLLDLDRWEDLDTAREPPLPIDDSDGGCPDEPSCAQYTAWTRQHPAIEIAEEDAISDSGPEVYNLLQQRGIQTVMILGVHTNMCVLGRPFSIRRLVRLGKNVVLVRDLTDSMYNPRMRPYVSHFRGTELVIEHIEAHWCPTITSDQIAGGQPFRFKD
ncbi:MAG TPA: isochorismatase family protein [Chthonomonadaceae bacterium]|nr:isochorismatase family protein [Chthonomonadaceae bacterium]